MPHCASRLLPLSVLQCNETCKLMQEIMHHGLQWPLCQVRWYWADTCAITARPSLKRHHSTSVDVMIVQTAKDICSWLHHQGWHAGSGLLQHCCPFCTALQDNDADGKQPGPEQHVPGMQSMGSCSQHFCSSSDKCTSTSSNFTAHSSLPTCQQDWLEAWLPVPAHLTPAWSRQQALHDQAGDGKRQQHGWQQQQQLQMSLQEQQQPIAVQQVEATCQPSGAQYHQVVEAQPPTQAPVCSWPDYYALRGLPLSSPAGNAGHIDSTMQPVATSQSRASINTVCVRDCN